MSETNYSWTRERIGLEYITDEGQVATREPTPAELLRLVDALHADMTGTRTREYEQAITDRWMSS